MMNPGYNALSYCWGEEAAVHSVNGNPSAVHADLYGSLKILKEEAPTEPICMDAICINQTKSGRKKQPSTIDEGRIWIRYQRDSLAGRHIRLP